MLLMNKYAIIPTDLNMEVVTMKKFLGKYGNLFVALAFVFTTFGVNTACTYILHQEKLPAEAKKLRKF